jgi:hypothetical protein
MYLQASVKVQESACRTDLREQRFAVTDLQTPLQSAA